MFEGAVSAVPFIVLVLHFADYVLKNIHNIHIS